MLIISEDFTLSFNLSPLISNCIRLNYRDVPSLYLILLRINFNPLGTCCVKLLIGSNCMIITQMDDIKIDQMKVCKEIAIFTNWQKYARTKLDAMFWLSYTNHCRLYQIKYVLFFIFFKFFFNFIALCFTTFDTAIHVSKQLKYLVAASNIIIR